MPHLVNDQEGDFHELANTATYTHTNDDDTTEERPLSWVLKRVDMRYYGKEEGEHDESPEEDIKEILVSYDTSGNKYTIFPTTEGQGIVKIESA